VGTSAGFDFNAVPAVWRLAGLVLSQTAALTALLFYFGWARSRELYSYFGVDVELLDFSAADYLLRSVNSAFWPLLLLGVLAVGFTVGHSLVLAGSRSRRMPPIFLAAGVLLVAVGLAGIALADFERRVVIALTTSLTVGFLLIAYADTTWWRRRPASSARSRTLEAQLRTFLLLGLAVLGLFWSVSLYALVVGRERAETIHQQLRSRTEMVVFSKDRLSLNGSGLQEIPQPAGSRYRHRYSGLYLLAESRGRYFVLPVGWVKGEDTAMVIPETDDIRIDFQAPSAR